MRLFWKSGYDGTSMSDLSEALGLGRQSLYGAFGDKRALFLKCIDRYFDQVLTVAIVNVLEGPGSPLGNVHKVIDAWEAYAASAEFQGCLVGNSLAELGMRDADLDAVMRGKLNRLKDAFARAFERARDAGELAPRADTQALARALTAFAQGAALVSKVWRSADAVHETLEGMRALVDAHAKGKALRG